MRRTLWTLPAALSLAASGLVTAPGEAAIVTVPVDNMSFLGGSPTVPQGSTVVWRFDEPNHSTTSNQLFWDSGVRFSGSFSTRFDSAGSFGYHCTVHRFMMSGRVVVPVKTSKIARGKRVRWSSAASATRAYDVQIMRPGATKWRLYRNDTTSLSKKFRPKMTGRYHFRARTVNVGTGQSSGWSPAKAVRIR